MRVAKWSLGLAAVLAAMALPAQSADIARLEWGSFVVAEDSSNNGNYTRSISSDDGRSVTINFEDLEARVDAANSKATSHIVGHYDLVQPSTDRFSSYRVTIEGHVIKSDTAVTQLHVRIGDAEQTIDWPAGQSASEKFVRTLDFAAPADGRLPSPFQVDIEANASKTAPADEAYLSIKTVTISAGQSKIAAN